MCVGLVVGGAGVGVGVGVQVDMGTFEHAHAQQHKHTRAHTGHLFLAQWLAIVKCRPWLEMALAQWQGQVGVTALPPIQNLQATHSPSVTLTSIHSRQVPDQRPTPHQR